MSETNEIQAAAAAHKRAKEAGEAKAHRKQPPVTPLQIGLGIGSAALAAAVLYMGRKRR